MPTEINLWSWDMVSSSGGCGGCMILSAKAYPTEVWGLLLLTELYISYIFCSAPSWSLPLSSGWFAWKTCSLHIYLSYTSTWCFPFSSFRILLWMLKFWFTGSYSSAGPLLCSMQGVTAYLYSLPCWNRTWKQKAWNFMHTNDISFRAEEHETGARSESLVFKVWDSMYFSTFRDSLLFSASSCVRRVS